MVKRGCFRPSFCLVSVRCYLPGSFSVSISGLSGCDYIPPKLLLYKHICSPISHLYLTTSFALTLAFHLIPVDSVRTANQPTNQPPPSTLFIHILSPYIPPFFLPISFSLHVYPISSLFHFDTRYLHSDILYHCTFVGIVEPFSFLTYKKNLLDDDEYLSHLPYYLSARRLACPLPHSISFIILQAAAATFCLLLLGIYQSRVA